MGAAKTPGGFKIMDLRRIATPLISIALATCSGCASMSHPAATDTRVTKPATPTAPRLDLSDALHSLSEWAER